MAHRLRLRSYFAALALLFITACGTPEPFHHTYASGHYSSDIIQCVPYARAHSGVKLRGDAYSWWASAEEHYRRGQVPEQGAVLVLKRTSRLRSGHVAVVKNVISTREINVMHSDWGSDRSHRHIIYESMRAEDISPGNDWTQVRFWNEDRQIMGLPYPAYGFIYP